MIMSTNSPSLAKITAPRLQQVLARKQLLGKLHEAKDRKIAWVVGPPGSGKTTLVRSFLEEEGLRFLWYQVDSGDSDPGTLFHYLNLAKRAQSNKPGKDLPSFLPEYQSDLPNFGIRFFLALFSRFRKPFAIVLDNYQELPEDAPMHRLLDDGIKLLPDHGLLIVISRQNPPSALARVRANQDMSLVGWEDLRLNDKETREITRLLGIRKTDKTVLDAIREMASGWAAGLVLMLEAFQGKKIDLNALRQSTQGSLFDYFASEVFELMDTDVQEFLLLTSLLPQMTVELAEKLTGNSSSGKILENLYSKNYFTEKKVEKQTYYQYHALFREFLQNRANKDLSSKRIQDLRAKSAELLVQSGNGEAAVNLLMESGLWKEVAATVALEAKTMMEQNRLATVAQWLGKIPSEIVNHSAWLMYWLATCELARDLISSRSHFERAFDLFEADNDLRGQLLSTSGVIESYLYEWSNFSGLDPWIEKLESLITPDREVPSREMDAKVSGSMFCALAFRRPDHPNFKYWEQRAKALVLSDLDIRHKIIIANQLVLYYSFIGSFSESSIIIETLEPEISRSEIDPLCLAVWRSMEGIVYWLQLKTDKCLSSIENGLKISEENGVHLWDFMLQSQGMHGALNANDRSKSATLLGSMTKSLQPTRRLDAAHFHYIAAFHELTKSNLGKALEHARSSVQYASQTGSPFPQIMAHMSLAQVLFERGDDQEAVLEIRKAEEINSWARSRFMQAHMEFIEAYFCIETYREDKGKSLLQNALKISREDNIVVTTWWRRNMMAKLLAFALANDIEKEYSARLVQMHQLRPPTGFDSLDNWPWLIKIQSLGHFSILVNGQPLQFGARTQSKPLELLKTLIGLGGREVSETKMVEALWPDAEGDAAHRAFDTNLHRLRKLIGNDKALVLQDGRLSLNSEIVWLDCWELETVLGNMDKLLRLEHDINVVHQADRILSLYRGLLLEDDDDKPFLIPLRERIHRRFLRQMDAIGRHWEVLNQWQIAIDYYQKVLDIDPVAEIFYQRLMVAYRQTGSHAEIVTTYQRCKNVLNSVLEIEPSPVTEELRESLLSS